MDRALLVGIDAYRPPFQPLKGCVQDTKEIEKLLLSNYDFAAPSISILTDEAATKIAVIERLGWLLHGVKPGDRILFYFSGNGAKARTQHPEAEPDGYDELICPVDFVWFDDDHAIRNKEFEEIFSSIPSGVSFIWISDSCYSGGLVRESMIPRGSKRPKSLIPPPELGTSVQKARDRGMKAKGFRKKTADLNLAFISACRSDQQSLDAVGGMPNSALTYYLLKSLATPAGRNAPLTDLIRNVRSELKANGLEQEPQLEGSRFTCQRPFLA
jgi:hypothetical protein